MVPELRQVQASAGQDKARIPDCVVAVGVTRIQMCALGAARLRSRSQSDGNPRVVVSRRSDGSVFSATSVRATHQPQELAIPKDTPWRESQTGAKIARRAR